MVPPSESPPHPDPRADRRAYGKVFEDRARLFLERAGLRCLAANWHCRLGELDLVMQDDEQLVFVEVRARRAGNTVSAVESVGSAKCRRLAAAARHWLMMNPAHARLAARFDIIAFDQPDADAAPTWLVNAFDVAPG